MTEIEYNILDELYFVCSFSDLKEKLRLSEGELKFNLLNLIDKGWLNYFQELDGIQNPSLADVSKALNNLYFLASKEGLFAHNSR